MLEGVKVNHLMQRLNDSDSLGEGLGVMRITEVADGPTSSQLLWIQVDIFGGTMVTRHMDLGLRRAITQFRSLFSKSKLPPHFRGGRANKQPGEGP